MELGFYRKNQFPLTKLPQADKPDLPSIFCQDRLARERDFSKNPSSVSDRELAKAVQLQRKAVRAQIVEERVLDTSNHHADHVFGLLFRR